MMLHHNDAPPPFPVAPSFAHHRPFSSGSRQTPDPIDKYLEKVGYYRKHTARDSTSLYRCVAEQMFDSQTYHEFVRQECIRYMGRQRAAFEEVSGGITESFCDI